MSNFSVKLLAECKLYGNKVELECSLYHLHPGFSGAC